jgi:hypothetical protein
MASHPSEEVVEGDVRALTTPQEKKEDEGINELENAEW